MRNTSTLLIQTCFRLELDANYLISGLKKLFNKNIFFGGMCNGPEMINYVQTTNKNVNNYDSMNQSKQMKTKNM